MPSAASATHVVMMTKRIGLDHLAMTAAQRVQ
jgi:hypothetical protein